MKKIYTTPILDVVEFIVSDICTTSGGSETIPIDQEPIEEGGNEAPQRKSIWSD